MNYVDFYTAIWHNYINSNTGMILDLDSKILSDIIDNNCALKCPRVYMFYHIACFYCALSEMTK